MFENGVLRRRLGTKRGKMTAENCILDMIVIFTLHKLLSLFTELRRHVARVGAKFLRTLFVGKRKKGVV
jgi:hypothetical protein